MKLFFLPALVLINVLKFLDPYELLFFAQCSKRSANIIKLSGTNRYKMRVSTSWGTYEVEIGKYTFAAKNTRYMRHYNDFVNQEIGGTIVPTLIWRSCRNEQTIMCFFWSDESAGFKTLVEHVATVFDCPISLYYSDDNNWSLPILQFIKGRQSEIDYLKISVQDCTADQIRSILQDLRVTEQVVASHLTEDFQYPEEHISSNMCFWHASWFKVDNSMLTQCVKLDLRCTLWTNQHLNQFMKNWDSLAYPQLEWLQIESRNFDRTPVFGQQVPSDLNSRHVKKTYGERTLNTRCGVFIKRSDGADAFLCLEGSSFTLLLNYEIRD